MLGSLASKYESNSDAAAVSQDPDDAGGWSYGLYQFSSAYGVVQDFVEWLCEQPAPYDEYGSELAAAGDAVGDQSFADRWGEIGAADDGGFAQMQDDYAKTLYFDPGAANLLTWYGFDVRQRSNALQQVLFSNCIQHGPRYGSEVFGDAAKLAGADLSAMPDREIIWNVYEVKLTDPAWSSGSPADRPGLFARWRGEREDALALLG